MENDAQVINAIGGLCKLHVKKKRMNLSSQKSEEA